MSDLFPKLGIEWHIIVAQAINFAILAFVLTRFVYKPVTKLLDARKARIEKDEQRHATLEERLAEIETARSEVLLGARKESEQIIAAAKVAAAETAEKIAADGKNEATRAIRESRKLIERERQKLVIDAKKEIASLVIATVEATLSKNTPESVRTALVDEALAIMSNNRE